MTCTQESGTCRTCQSGCSQKPGWFAPDEAERAAEYLSMPLADFFAQYLAVDWWEGDHRIPKTTFVLSPAITGEDAGTEFPGDPRGTCVFYKGGRCQIHAVKPGECRERWCGDDGSSTVHQDIAVAWTAHQDQITDLLGREPMAEAYEGDLFSGIFGSIFGGS